MDVATPDTTEKNASAVAKPFGGQRSNKTTRICFSDQGSELGSEKSIGLILSVTETSTAVPQRDDIYSGIARASSLPCGKEHKSPRRRS